MALDDNDYDFDSAPRVPVAAPPRANRINPAEITSGWGAPRSYGGHTGDDLGWRHGEGVGVARSGRVRFAGETKGYGKRVEVEHDDGTVTTYSHLSGIDVNKDDDLDEGSLLGRVGNTGHSFGDHLHFEVLRRGRKVNPLTTDFAPVRGAKEVKRRAGRDYDFDSPSYDFDQTETAASSQPVQSHDSPSRPKPTTNAGPARAEAPPARTRGPRPTSDDPALWGAAAATPEPEDDETARRLLDQAAAPAPGGPTVAEHEILNNSLPDDTPERLPGLRPHGDRVEPTGEPGSVRVVDERAVAPALSGRGRRAAAEHARALSATAGRLAAAERDLGEPARAQNAPPDEGRAANAVRVGVAPDATPDEIALSALKSYALASGVSPELADSYASEASDAVKRERGGKFFGAGQDEFLQSARRAGGANVLLTGSAADVLSRYLGGQESGRRVESQMSLEAGVELPGARETLDATKAAYWRSLGFDREPQTAEEVEANKALSRSTKDFLLAHAGQDGRGNLSFDTASLPNYQTFVAQGLEEERRQREQEELARSLTPEDRAEVSRRATALTETNAVTRSTLAPLLNSIAAGGEDVLGGIYRVAEDIVNSTGVAGDGHDIADYFKKHAYMTRAVVEEADRASPMSAPQKAFAFGSDLLGNVALMSAMGELGGSKMAFGGTGFLGSLGRGEAYDRATVEGVKGLALDKVFRASEALPLAQRGPAIAAATYGIERATGANEGQAISAALTNAGFVAVHPAAEGAARAARSLLGRDGTAFTPPVDTVSTDTVPAPVARDLTSDEVENQATRAVSPDAGNNITGERVGGTDVSGRPAAIKNDRATPVPETPQPLSARLEDLKAGRRAVVTITQEELSDPGGRVVVPAGFRSFKTFDDGRIVYNPELVARGDVVKAMDAGKLGELARPQRKAAEESLDGAGAEGEGAGAGLVSERGADVTGGAVAEVRRVEPARPVAVDEPGAPLPTAGVSKAVSGADGGAPGSLNASDRIVTGADARARFTEGGEFDMASASDALAREAQSALNAGGRVTLRVDGKPVEIARVTRGMLEDTKGRRWGLMSLFTGTDGRNSLTFSPKAAESAAVKPQDNIPQNIRSDAGETSPANGDGVAARPEAAAEEPGEVPPHHSNFQPRDDSGTFAPGRPVIPADEGERQSLAKSLRARLESAGESEAAPQTPAPTPVKPDNSEVKVGDSYRRRSDGKVLEVRSADAEGVRLGERGGEGRAARTVARDRFERDYEKTAHKFSSTQVDLPETVAREVRAVGERLIPDSELYTDPADDSYGREERPHVTVKYGLHTEDAEEVRHALAGEPPVAVTLGKLSVFPGKGDTPYDVVKADVDSPDLHRLNKKIGDSLKVTDTHPEYVPHVTLAYVKRGEGKKYAGDSSLEGKRLTFDSVTFSSSNGETVPVKLGGRAEGEILQGEKSATSNTDTRKRDTPAKEEQGSKPKRAPAKIKFDPEVHDLTRFVLSEGGVRVDRDGGNRGEVMRLHKLRPGLINNQSGRTVEEMARAAAAAGFRVGEGRGYAMEGVLDKAAGVGEADPDEFLGMLEEDAGGLRKHFTASAEIEPSELDELDDRQREGLDAEMRFLADPHVVSSLREVREGHEDEGLREELYTLAANYGVPDEAVDSHLDYARESGVGLEGASEARAEQGDASFDFADEEVTPSDLNTPAEEHSSEVNLKDGSPLKVRLRRRDADTVAVGAYVEGRGAPVGSVEFRKNADGTYSADTNLYVEPAQRRKGVATAMYDAAERAGMALRPSEQLLPAGAAFWKSRGPSPAASRPEVVSRRDGASPRGDEAPAEGRPAEVAPAKSRAEQPSMLEPTGGLFGSPQESAAATPKHPADVERERLQAKEQERRASELRKAFGDDGAEVERLSKSDDKLVRAVAGKLLDRAADLRADKSSDTKDLTLPLKKLADLREQGVSVDEYERQGGMFDTGLDPEQMATLRAYASGHAEARVSQLIENAGAETPPDDSHFIPRDEAEYEAAKERVNRNLKKLLSPSNLASGFYPAHVVAELLPDLARLGAYHVRNGARDFAEWSRRVVADVGEGIRPHLESIYGEAKKLVEGEHGDNKQPDTDGDNGDAALTRGADSYNPAGREQPGVGGRAAAPAGVDARADARDVRMDGDAALPGAEEGQAGAAAEATASGTRQADSARTQGVRSFPRTLEAADLEGGAPTGINNATTDAERASRDLSPVEVEARRTFGRAWEDARERVDSGEIDPRSLAAELSEKPRPLTAEESAALVYDRAKLQNAHRAVMAEIEGARAEGDENREAEARARLAVIEAAVDTNDRAAKKTGYEQGLGLAARRMMAREDYSLDTLIQRARVAAKGGEVPEEVRTKLEELSSKLEYTEERLANARKTIEGLEADRAVRRMQREVRRRKRAATKAELDDEFAALRAQFAQARAKNQGVQPSGLAGLDPEGELSALIVRMAKNRVRAGVNTVEGLVDEIHSALSDFALEKRDIRDAVSGYGKTSEMSRDEARARLDELRRQMRLASAVEDAEAGRRPSKTGPRREPDSQKVRSMRRELRSAMEAHGLVEKPGPVYGPKKSDMGPLQGPRLSDSRPEGPRLSESTEPKQGPRDWLPAAKERLQSEIDDLAEQLKSGRFKKSEPRTPLVYDEEGERLRTERDGLKRKVDNEIRRLELQNRSRAQKAADFILKFRRAVLLSSVRTLGKLTAAATGRAVTTPAEELIGGALSRLPVVRRIAEKAPREGGFSAHAEKAALSALFSKGMLREAKATLTGEDGLSVRFGGKEHSDPELLDLFGRVHGALKTPAKYSEFFRAVEKRAAHARRESIRKGMSPEDADAYLQRPDVQAAVAAKAYEDAQRAILMQDNWLVNKYKGLIRTDKNSGPAEGALSKVAQFFLPIVKVPTNFVFETSSYAVGGLKAAAALRHGIEALTPDQADYVMRALKKQALGAGLLTLGWIFADAIGGYYQPGDDKRKKKDGGGPEEGSVRVFGHEVPRLFLHVPAFEMLQVAATVRRVYERERRKGHDQPVARGAYAAGKGLAMEIPFFETPARLAESLADWEGARKFAGEAARDLAVPPDVQRIARAADENAGGRPVKRYPHGFIDSIEAGVPGLRKNVSRERAPGEHVPLSETAQKYFDEHDKLPYAAPSKLSVAGRDRDLSADERSQIERDVRAETNRRVEAFFAPKDEGGRSRLDRYETAPAEEQKKILDGLQRDAAEHVRSQFKRAFQDAHTGEIKAEREGKRAAARAQRGQLIERKEKRGVITPEEAKRAVERLGRGNANSPR